MGDERYLVPGEAVVERAWVPDVGGIYKGGGGGSVHIIGSRESACADAHVAGWRYRGFARGW